MTDERRKAFSEELSEMDLVQVTAKLESNDEEVRNTDDLELVAEKAEEKSMLLERKAELEALKERNAAVEEIENGAHTNTIEHMEAPEMEERKIYGVDTPEYRSAFLAYLAGNATEEQRGMFADNTNNGDGISLPVGIDERIWDQVHTAHPILADITKLNSGIAIKVTRMTPSAATKGKDSAVKTEQTETHVEVTLVGADFTAKMKMSHAEAKMSQGAMETFLVEEVAAAVGEALAKDVFARILSDATTAQKVTATANVYSDIASALALASGADNAVIYANNADYYKILGAVDTNGQPIVRNGVALNAILKKDNAATKITVVDPKKFVLNVIQDTIVKATDDEDFNRVISALCRAEGTLRNVKAAAYIA